MIQEFINIFDDRREELLNEFRAEHPERYADIVQKLIECIGTGKYGEPDPKRITCIDHGEYQGTLLFVVGAKGYQPTDYWYVKVDYGSCSGCDTLKRIKEYSNDKPTEKQAQAYFTLALHILQNLKKMED